MKNLEVDYAIIGAGPTGLYGAYYAGFRGWSTAVIDALPEVGGQITAMYPEKDIFDVAGFPAVRGRVLVEQLKEQADQFSPNYVLGEQASELSAPEGGPVTLTTAQGSTITAKALVITGGIGSFRPRPLPAGSDWEDKGLAFFVPKPDHYANKEVVIVGGGGLSMMCFVCLSICLFVCVCFVCQCCLIICRLNSCSSMLMLYLMWLLKLFVLMQVMACLHLWKVISMSM